MHPGPCGTVLVSSPTDTSQNPMPRPHSLIVKLARPVTTSSISRSRFARLVDQTSEQELIIEMAEQVQAAGVMLVQSRVVRQSVSRGRVDDRGLLGRELESGQASLHRDVARRRRRRDLSRFWSLLPSWRTTRCKKSATQDASPGLAELHRSLIGIDTFGTRCQLQQEETRSHGHLSVAQATTFSSTNL